MDHPTIESFAESFASAPRLAEMEIRSESHGTLRFRRSLQSAEKRPRPVTKAVATAPLPTSSPTTVITPVQDTDTVVTSTLVGIFRAAKKVPIGVGSTVSAGQTIGMIEVMRLSDEIVSPISGTVSAIYVLDTQPVEYGQPLFEITADSPEEGQEENA